MKRMKQVLALLLSLALLLGMAAVAEEAEAPVEAEVVEIVEDAEPIEEPAPEPEEAPEEPEVVDPEAEEPTGKPTDVPVDEPVETLNEVAVEAEQFNAEGDFVIEDGVLIDYTGSDTDVVVPNTVQKIARTAFQGNKTIVSVHLPESLTTIEHWAFSDCISLASINIPGSVTSIEDLVFDGCYNLKSIVFEDGEADLSIYGTIMYGTDSDSEDTETPPMQIESITVGRNIINTGEKIGGWLMVFRDLYNLSSVKFTDGVTRIPHHFIEYCSNLQTLSIPESMVSIEDHAMAWCDLREVRLPAGLTSIGEDAFVGSHHMTAILDKGSYAEQYCKGNAIKYKYFGSSDLPVTGAKVVLSPATATLTQKEAVTLKATTEGLSKSEKYSFTSSDKNVATVSSAGKITAKGVGTAVITAKGKTSKQEASCTVTVISAPQTVRIEKPTKVDYTTDDEAFSLVASVEPADAAQSVKWTSSDETVARVSAEGQVTLVGQGKATITAKSEKKGTNGKQRSDTFVLNVEDLHMPANVKIVEKASGPVYVDKDKPLTLHYAMDPVKEGQEPISAVTWSIPKAKERKIATINAETGEITPIKEGSATVKITTQKKGGTGSKKKQLTDTVKITVVDPLKPRSVQINDGEKEIPLYYKAGETLSLKSTIEPATATPGVKWSISSKTQRKIATIDSATGVVTPTGTKFGVVTVKVETTAKKSNKKAATATIKIAVVDPKYPYSVKIIQEDGSALQDGVELKVGQTLKLSASIEPATATEKTGISWSISKSQRKYATVDQDGTVTGAKAGKTVTITAKTANGKKATIKIKIVP